MCVLCVALTRVDDGRDGPGFQLCTAACFHVRLGVVPAACVSWRKVVACIVT